MHKGMTHLKAVQSTGAAAAPAPAREKTEIERREARVSELRKQYQAGQYKVDSLALSRKLIDSHLIK
jgi:anti-sigma28 factor (negative regulator of flagellin synthesis)